MMGANGRVRLLNPGPVTLSARVRRAMARPDMCHREAECSEMMIDVRARLEHIYEGAGDEYGAVLLTGSGTAAVEAMVGSLVAHDGNVLVVSNGVYGERICDMLRVQRKSAEVIRSEWTSPINLEAVERRLAEGRRPSHVITVHHETTTGRLNDLPALGALCRRYDVPLLLDAVSSFAGEAMNFAAWNVEACASTANKCLHGVPGICFVLIRKEVVDRRPSSAASVYLDLFSNYRAQRRGTPLFTPAVQSLYALQEALAELEDGGGWQVRHRRYSRLSQRIRTALTEQGVGLLLSDPTCYSATLSSFRLPDESTFQRLHAYLKRFGFVIYPGQGLLENIIFRIAVMGDLEDGDVDELLECLQRFFLPS